MVEFWEIKGGISKNFSKVYLKRMVNRIKGIIFMFDCTNLKSLYDIFKWIILLKSAYENKDE